MCASQNNKYCKTLYMSHIIWDLFLNIGMNVCALQWGPRPDALSEQHLATPAAGATTSTKSTLRRVDDDLINRLTLRLPRLLFPSWHKHPGQEERNAEDRAWYQSHLLASCYGHFVSEKWQLSVHFTWALKLVSTDVIPHLVTCWPRLEQIRAAAFKACLKYFPQIPTEVVNQPTAEK